MHKSLKKNAYIVKMDFELVTTYFEPLILDLKSFIIKCFKVVEAERDALNKEKSRSKSSYDVRRCIFHAE